MFRYQEIPARGDPSLRIQEFSEVIPRLHCCRYWWMEEWLSQHMSFPYWRMYWNRSGRAKVVYKKTFFLGPDRIILIPPHTPFSTDIEGSLIPPGQHYSLRGNRVDSRKMEQQMSAQGMVLHFFVHFSLGYPYDSISPEIFEFTASETQGRLIHSITGQLIAGRDRFAQAESMELYALLFSLLGNLPPGTWSSKQTDPRVVAGIQNMEMRMGSERIENSTLASLARMSTNAYARLFREQTGYSPGKYLQRLRVEKASNLLHHSDMSIEQIAAECGFCDRYHLTRVFTRIMHIPPAAYRKSGLTAKY